MTPETPTLPSPWITTPAAAHEASDDLLGGKGANLVRLVRADFPVPRFFTLTTAAFEAATGPAFREAIEDRIALLDPANPAAVKQVSLEICDRFLGMELGPALRAAIRDAYRELGGAETRVAVRSSAVGEDSGAHSFAGQLDTFLHVRGEDEVLRAILGCWASAYSERSLVYRHQNGLSASGARVGVVVQEMVAGEVSGVLFTANPTNGRRRESVVSATWGLGEGLVSGELDADHWVIDRSDRSMRATVVSKPEQVVLDVSRGQGTTRQPVATELQEAPCLEEVRLLELADLGDRLSEHFGAPQDVEWTLRGDRLVLLQSRPITALPHEPRGRPGLFDNANVSENYAGVTTPLTFSFASRCYEISYSQMAEVMGFDPEDVRRQNPLFKNMIALIEGRIYYNLGNWYELMAYLPGYSALRKFFALSIGARSGGGPEEGRGSGVWQLGRLVRRLLINYATWDREIERFEAHFHKVYEGMRRRPFGQMRLDELADSYLELERDLIWSWTAPNVNDFFSTLFYGLLKHLLVSWKLDETGSLQNDLLCGQGGLVSTEPTRAILTMARRAYSDPALRALIEGTETSRARDALRDRGNHPDFLAMVEDYLSRYGYRCMGELRLESIPLTVDSGFLFVTLANYLRTADRQGEGVLDFTQIEAREAEIRRKAEARVSEALGVRPLRRMLLNWVLGCARRAVRHRENTRLERTRAFGVVREIMSAIGVRMAERGLLAEARDVYYLTLDEILGWVQGRATCQDLVGLTALRKAEFAGFREKAPDDRFETLGAVYLDNPFRQEPEVAPSAPGELRGVSCCPGTVKGRAKVIRPGGDMRLDGEILVAERTDPGWIPLYPSAIALLIERGSLLSHSAIVAREMGLPTIVGLTGLMKKIEEGQYLELDAREGIVYLDREPAPRA